MYSVAIVEDENLARKAMALYLRDAGYTVHEASDALVCRALPRQTHLDAIVLDLGLPGIDGLSFAREIRRESNMGLIIVTRRSDPDGRIAALDLGADDYLVKPVHYGELAARIRSVMRRSGRERARRKIVGQWPVDLEARTVDGGAENANLTRGEFDILARLIQADTKIVSRQELLSVISRSPLTWTASFIQPLVESVRHLDRSGPVLQQAEARSPRVSAAPWPINAFETAPLATISWRSSPNQPKAISYPLSLQMRCNTSSRRGRPDHLMADLWYH